MIKFPFESKPLMIGALVVLIGAPTAGATMTMRARSAAVAEAAPGALMQIELVAPKEPVVAATYPLETFEAPPVNEFKGRLPHGRAWRVGFEMDFGSAPMRAEPAGDYRGFLSDEARLEQARFEQVRDDYMRAERARAAQALEQAAAREVQVREASGFGPARDARADDSDAADPAG